MQIAQKAECPVAMTSTDDQGTNAERSSCPSSSLPPTPTPVRAGKRTQADSQDRCGVGGW